MRDVGNRNVASSTAKIMEFYNAWRMISIKRIRRSYTGCVKIKRSNMKTAKTLGYNLQ